MKFKVGDVVQLKSGGPEMTIKAIGAYDTGQEYVKCVWFIGTETTRATTWESFSPEVLREYVQSSVPSPRELGFKLSHGQRPSSS